MFVHLCQGRSENWKSLAGNPSLEFCSVPDWKWKNTHWKTLRNLKVKNLCTKSKRNVSSWIQRLTYFLQCIYNMTFHMHASTEQLSAFVKESHFEISSFLTFVAHPVNIFWRRNQKVWRSSFNFSVQIFFVSVSRADIQFRGSCSELKYQVVHSKS